MDNKIAFKFDIDDSKIDNSNLLVDKSSIEDNDTLFWEHKYTSETDNDGFQAYSEEIVSNIKTNSTNKMSFINRDI